MPAGMPNGYGSLAFSPGGGGIGSKRPGVGFMSPVNSGARMTPGKLRAAQRSATGGIKRQFPTGSYNKPGPMSLRASGGGMPSGAGAPPPVKPKGSGGLIRGLGNMSSRNKIMMGAGALVLGAAAYSGRRGNGTSSGRSGMTRY